MLRHLDAILDAVARRAMTVTIAGTTFDQHEYDERGDVLYLSVGDPREPTRTIATPEGHAATTTSSAPSSAWF